MALDPEKSKLESSRASLIYLSNDVLHAINLLKILEYINLNSITSLHAPLIVYRTVALYKADAYLLIKLIHEKQGTVVPVVIFQTD